ncbi:MAG: hypothetical protein V7L14_11680 [Nostoc sp.]
MPNAQCPMPNAQCPMPMPNAQCPNAPMPNAQCPNNKSLPFRHFSIILGHSFRGDYLC